MIFQVKANSRVRSSSGGWQFFAINNDQLAMNNFAFAFEPAGRQV